MLLTISLPIFHDIIISVTIINNKFKTSPSYFFAKQNPYKIRVIFKMVGKTGQIKKILKIHNPLEIVAF